MKHLTLALAVALLLVTGAASAVDADIDGATAGKWTMDLDAAKKLAAEKDLPILLNFSGSDWCRWCKIMENNVFSKEEWSEYAQQSLVMVLLDFPRDKTLVPEKYKKRNEELNDKYGVRGFPTFVILDSDGTTELGRLGAGREKTPSSVQEELKALFRYRDAEIKRYAEGLGDTGADYLAIIGELTSAKEQIAERKAAIAEAEAKIEKLEEKLDAQFDAARDFRAQQLSVAERKEYEQIKAEHAAAERDLEEWLESEPKPTPETRKTFREKSERVSAAEAKLNKY